MLSQTCIVSVWFPWRKKDGCEFSFGFSAEWIVAARMSEGEAIVAAD